MAEFNAITAVPGIIVGHWTDLSGPTGCTVVLAPAGAVASVDVRGGAPGTRNTELLRPGNLVDRIHAVLLTGGSEFGLDAATGVVRWLEEHGHGFPISTGFVPVVCGAVLFDLSLGSSNVRPNAESGYTACLNASAGQPQEGSVGAGAGATVAKALGPERMLKGGLGTAAERTASGITVAAIVAVNSFGEIVDPDTAQVIAGPRGDQPGAFADTIIALRKRPADSPFAPRNQPPNTTLAVIATDAVLGKEDAYRLAVIAQTGLARTIRPVHTPVDGDSLFTLATCQNPTETDILQLGALAARALERAVVRAVSSATGLAGVPSASEWLGKH